MDELDVGQEIHMKPLITITLSAIFLLIAGCNAEPKGMERKIDGSSDAAAKQSVEKLTTELSPEELKKFTAAYGQLALRWAFSNVFSREQKQDSSEFLKIINGKTPQKVIDLAAAQAADKADKTSDKDPENAKEQESKFAFVNLPFNIDGIEILITDLRFGKLQKIEKQYSFGSVPEGEFLLATVAIKNTTEGKIIQIQDAWGDTTVTDNFDNTYNKPSSLTYSSGDIKGSISSKALKPGETASDMIIIEKPLDNAQEFILRSAPNFFRSAGNNMLHQLSSDSFHLKFKRADIK